MEDRDYIRAANIKKFDYDNYIPVHTVLLYGKTQIVDPVRNFTTRRKLDARIKLYFE